jgi:hypothetical protein
MMGRIADQTSSKHTGRAKNRGIAAGTAEMMMQNMVMTPAAAVHARAWCSCGSGVLKRAGSVTSICTATPNVATAAERRMTGGSQRPVSETTLQYNAPKKAHRKSRNGFGDQVLNQVKNWVRAEDTELDIVQEAEESAQQIGESQDVRRARRKDRRSYMCARAIVGGASGCLIPPIVRRAFFVRIGPPSQRLRRVWRVRRPLWVEGVTNSASGSDGPKRWILVLSVTPVSISPSTSI